MGDCQIGMRTMMTWITAVEAATWIALGECESADNLRRKVDQKLAEWRPRPDRHAPLFTDVFDDAGALTNACDILIEAARAGKIELWGVPKQSKVAEDFQKLGLDVLLPSVTINLLHNHLEADDRTPDDWIMARQQTFIHLKVRRSEIESLISLIDTGGSSSRLTNAGPEMPRSRQPIMLLRVKEELRIMSSEDRQAAYGQKELLKVIKGRTNMKDLSISTLKRAQKAVRDQSR